MGDGGLGLGAALAVLGKKVQFDTLYLGRTFTDQEILSAITDSKFEYYKPVSIAFEVGKILAENKIVARYSGGSEYGPRSLGNRSILYSASDKAVNGWLNQRLDRTEFMPFAPVVREIDMNKYFVIEKHMQSFRHMTLACDVTSHGIESAPATTHIDNTARPQLIVYKDNTAYYEILSEYEKLSGEGILVNTSFNLHEEPIVYSPSEALNTFRSSKLDYLAIGNYIVCQQK
jgi:carbamoyltransferase